MSSSCLRGLLILSLVTCFTQPAADGDLLPEFELQEKFLAGVEKRWKACPRTERGFPSDIQKHIHGLLTPPEIFRISDVATSTSLPSRTAIVLPSIISQCIGSGYVMKMACIAAIGGIKGMVAPFIPLITPLQHIIPMGVANNSQKVISLFSSALPSTFNLFPQWIPTKMTDFLIAACLASLLTTTKNQSTIRRSGYINSQSTEISFINKMRGDKEVEVLEVQDPLYVTTPNGFKFLEILIAPGDYIELPYTTMMKRSSYFIPPANTDYLPTFPTQNENGSNEFANLTISNHGRIADRYDNTLFHGFERPVHKHAISSDGRHIAMSDLNHIVILKSHALQKGKKLLNAKENTELVHCNSNVISANIKPFIKPLLLGACIYGSLRIGRKIAASRK